MLRPEPTRDMFKTFSQHELCGAISIVLSSQYTNIAFHKEIVISARTKLNGMFITGAVVMAAIAGSLTHSWVVFVFTALVAAGIMIHMGEVRMSAARGCSRNQSRRNSKRRNR